MAPNELVDMVEVSGFRHCAVVVTVRQFFPHYDLGLAEAEQLLHVTWSNWLLVIVHTRRSNKEYLRNDLVLESAQEQYRDGDLRNHLFATPVLVAKWCQPLCHRDRIRNHLCDAEECVLKDQALDIAS